MMTQQQIKELITRSKQNDTTAFALLVTEFQGMIFRLAFRLLCNEVEARDMVQEIFVKIWLSLDKYNDTFRFSTWIYKITCNICYDRLRALQHSPSGYLSDTLSVSGGMVSEENIEKVLENKELKDLILRFTEELTPKQRLVFTLRDIEELEVAEVVIITGLSPEKIKHNLYQARKQIKSKIHQIDPDL